MALSLSQPTIPLSTLASIPSHPIPILVFVTSASMEGSLGAKAAEEEERAMFFDTIDMGGIIPKKVRCRRLFPSRLLRSFGSRPPRSWIGHWLTEIRRGDLSFMFDDDKGGTRRWFFSSEFRTHNLCFSVRPQVFIFRLQYVKPW